jgi:hypothetical protein
MATRNATCPWSPGGGANTSSKLFWFTRRTSRPGRGRGRAG